jgi:cytidine deaminase
LQHKQNMIAFPEEDELITQAKEASKGSFAPMSGFSVGAAVLVQDTKGNCRIYKGSNYETQNYRSVCAEKHSLQSAHLDCSIQDSLSPKFLAIAIYSPNSADFIVPCGDCRQALFEQNPEMKVICLDNKGNKQEYLAKDLLPNGFRLTQAAGKGIESPLLEYIVHYPVFAGKLELLAGIEGLITVGSPARAEKLAKFLRAGSQLGPAIIDEYCHLASKSTDREYSLFTAHWPEKNLKIGIASHGIGASGVEIMLAELSALVTLANQESGRKTETTNSPLKAVIRSGTRGTIADVKLGTIGISTTCHSEASSNEPSPELLQTLQACAKQNSDLLSESGPCLSAQFFWSGQGRTSFPLLGKAAAKESENDTYLRSLLKKGIKWIEMEDFYLNHFAQNFGIASASLGVVVAKRYDAELDKFVLSYDKQAKGDFELKPALIALDALYKFLK